MGQYKGHQFYYKILKTSVTLFENNCTHLDNLLSIPIWFNRFLKTKFDAEISARFYLNFPTGKLFGKLSFLQKHFAGGT